MRRAQVYRVPPEWNIHDPERPWSGTVPVDETDWASIGLFKSQQDAFTAAMRHMTSQDAR